MAKFIYQLNQTLDGYVDHTNFRPSLALFRHFTEEVCGLAGCLYGRRIYEVLRYWDNDAEDWGVAEREFAQAWQRQPKWVVSRSLESVGPNATLVQNDVESKVRALKANVSGEIEVAGPELAGHLTEIGLIDEYRIYLHPTVAGSGKPFFTGPRPSLRLVANDAICDDVVRLTYTPA